MTTNFGVNMAKSAESSKVIRRLGIRKWKAYQTEPRMYCIFELSRMIKSYKTKSLKND